jgi:hypothetical protein
MAKSKGQFYVRTSRKTYGPMTRAAANKLEVKLVRSSPITSRGKGSLGRKTGRGKGSASSGGGG